MTAGAITIEMPFRLWTGIDACMDNKAQQAMEDYWEAGGDIGDPASPDIGPTARLAMGILEEGWRQLPDSSRPPDGSRPADERVDMVLVREQWEFVPENARESLSVHEQWRRAGWPPYQDMPAAVELYRQIIAVVGPALTGGGR